MANNQIDMLGILAPAGDSILHGKESVFINSQKDIQYIVKRISFAPQHENTESSIPYTGYMDSLSGGYENQDDISQDDDTRKATFIEDFERRVFIFNGWYDSYRDAWKLSKGTVIAERTQCDGMLATKYVTIPVYQPKEQTKEWEREKRVYLERNYSSYDEFLSLLKQKNRIGLVKGFHEPISSPFIIWQDNNSNECYAVGGFEKCVASDSGYQFIYEDYLGVIKLGEEYQKGIVYPDEFNPTIMYLEVSCYSELYNRFAKQDVDNYIVKPVVEEKADNLAKKNPSEEGSQSKELRELSTEKNERNLLEYCKYYAHRSNLYYDDDDLANFHTAVKTRSLVILSGMSGTGKSRLVEVYAKALGIKPESTLIIPVRPSWNDDSDLLGYVDLNKMVYRPSETGFIELLREAHDNDDQMYLVCFDEMNLARVEHYFSQFLSILEKPADSQRKLRIYSDSLKGLYNASEYPSEIPIGNNIIFVGTVNIDESTYHFSDKVLDRSNVMQLKVLDYSKEWKKVNYAAVPPMNSWTMEEFKKLIREPGDNEFAEYRSFLWEMHCRLQNVSDTLGIGPRVVKQIEKYLCNFPELDEPIEETKAKSFDLQLVQRVLTKLRGSEDKLKKLFDATGEQCSIFDDLFDQHANLSNFENSRSVLRRKKEELKVYGYCI